jgi:hypothetical protein
MEAGNWSTPTYTPTKKLLIQVVNDRASVGVKIQFIIRRFQKALTRKLCISGSLLK